MVSHPELLWFAMGERMWVYMTFTDISHFVWRHQVHRHALGPGNVSAAFYHLQVVSHCRLRFLQGSWCQCYSYVHLCLLWNVIFRQMLVVCVSKSLITVDLIFMVFVQVQLMSMSMFVCASSIRICTSYLYVYTMYRQRSESDTYDCIHTYILRLEAKENFGAE